MTSLTPLNTEWLPSLVRRRKPVGGISSWGRWVVWQRGRKEKSHFRSFFTHGAVPSFIRIGGVGCGGRGCCRQSHNQTCLSFHAQWPGSQRRSALLPLLQLRSPRPPHDRGTFFSFPFKFKSNLSRGICFRLKTWSCDAIHLRRSSEGEETREDLLAIMDYSKAQMVSIDGLGRGDAATRVCYSNKANVARYKVPHCPFCPWSLRFNY